MLSEMNSGQFAVNSSMMQSQSSTLYTRFQGTHSKDAAAYSLGAQLHFRSRYQDYRHCHLRRFQRDRRGGLIISQLANERFDYKRI